jgi:hypothetical protein
MVKAIKEGRPLVPGGPDGVMPEEMDGQPPAAAAPPPATPAFTPPAPTIQQPTPTQPYASSPQPAFVAPVSPPAATPTGMPGGGGGASAPRSYNPGYTPPIQPNTAQHVHNPSNAGFFFAKFQIKYFYTFCHSPYIFLISCFLQSSFE